MGADEHATTCGCDDYRLSRRSLLGRAAAATGALVLSDLLGDVWTQASLATEVTSEPTDVLVVLSLRGGADGLSIVVPHGDPGLAAARPTIGIPASRLLAPDPLFGLHPAFAPLLPMWDQGRFAAVHAVGLPTPNRSHFAAMELVEDADPGSAERTGWINRLVGGLTDPQVSSAVQLGRGVATTSMVGPTPTLSLSALSGLALVGAGTTKEVPIRRSLELAWNGTTGPLGAGGRMALETSERLASLAEAVDDPGGTTYPAGDLGTTLKQVGQLIHAQVGARVVAIDYGNWDMHTYLGRPEAGKMHAMVDELARCLAAFFRDVADVADRVTVVTVSEFGRRVTENGSYGLDHGYGNCMLLLGAGVRGGQVFGQWPGLSSADLVDNDLAVTTDYRTVLREVVASRFAGVDASRVFPGIVDTPTGAMA